MCSKSDAFLLHSLMKRHSPVDTAIPFFAIAHDRGDDLFSVPFHFIEPVANAIGPLITHGTIDQDQKIPIRFRDRISPGTGTVKNDLGLGLHFMNSSFYLLK